MIVDILAQVDATELFADGNANWRYCKEYATFRHRDACEFILHIHRPTDYDDANFLHEDTVNLMKDCGCTEDFIKAYEDARKAGAARVLFYA